MRRFAAVMALLLVACPLGKPQTWPAMAIEESGECYLISSHWEGRAQVVESLDMSTDRFGACLNPPTLRDESSSQFRFVAPSPLPRTFEDAVNEATNAAKRLAFETTAIVVSWVQKEEVKKLNLPPPQKGKVGAHNRGKGYVPLTPARRAFFQAQSYAWHGDHITRAAKNLTLPASFDGRVRVPLPIWDQGQCGSCYWVSTDRTFTHAGIMVGMGKADDSFKLALQWGMDRPRNFGGCDGGNGTEVADYIVKNGMPAESYIDAQGVATKDYPPYEARVGSDRTKPGAKVWAKGWTWGFVNPNGAPTIDEIKAALVLYGRLNIALDAGGDFDGSGTITSLGRNIDHEINAVAYDDNHDNGDGTKGAVLLENQWSDQWGDKGCKWCSYGACRAIVDWFFVSAGKIPPPDPVPPTGGVPPFKLYEGSVPALTQVGTPEGYATLVGAEAAATTFANQDKTPVLIYDSAKPSVLIETVKPGMPPGPTGDVFIMLDKVNKYTLTPEQVQAVLQQAGAMKIDPNMTLKQLLEQLKANGVKTQEPPLFKAPLKMLPPEEVRVPQMRGLSTSQLREWYARVEQLSTKALR